MKKLNHKRLFYLHLIKQLHLFLWYRDKDTNGRHKVSRIFFTKKWPFLLNASFLRWNRGFFVNIQEIICILSGYFRNIICRTFDFPPIFLGFLLIMIDCEQRRYNIFGIQSHPFSSFILSIFSLLSITSAPHLNEEWRIGFPFGRRTLFLNS